MNTYTEKLWRRYSFKNYEETYEETTWWKKVQEAETTRRLNKRGTFHWR